MGLLLFVTAWLVAWAEPPPMTRADVVQLPLRWTELAVRGEECALQQAMWAYAERAHGDVAAPWMAHFEDHDAFSDAVRDAARNQATWRALRPTTHLGSLAKNGAGGLHARLLSSPEALFFWNGRLWDGAGDLLNVTLRCRGPKARDEVFDRVTAAFVRWGRLDVTKTDGSTHLSVREYIALLRAEHEAKHEGALSPGTDRAVRRIVERYPYPDVRAGSVGQRQEAIAEAIGEHAAQEAETLGMTESGLVELATTIAPSDRVGSAMCPRQLYDGNLVALRRGAAAVAMDELSPTERRHYVAAGYRATVTLQTFGCVEGVAPRASTPEGLIAAIEAQLGATGRYSEECWKRRDQLSHLLAEAPEAWRERASEVSGQLAHYWLQSVQKRCMPL